MKRLLSYCVANLQGQGKRDYQEDSFAFVNALDVTLIRKEGLFLAVADGMGGMAGGDKASKEVIRTITSDFKQADRSRALCSQLSESVVRAGERVYYRLNGRGGSTVVAGVIFQENLYFVSVGDSYIWLLRNKELTRLNKPNNIKTDIYLESIRKGSVDPSKGRNNIEADALTQFVGMEGNLRPEVNYRPLPLSDGDMLVFCSDGVGSVLSEDELLSCLLYQNPEKACQYMEKLIKDKNYFDQDNYTALVVQCEY